MCLVFALGTHLANLDIGRRSRDTWHENFPYVAIQSVIYILLIVPLLLEASEHGSPGLRMTSLRSA